jgi:hypothetical protein
VELYDLKADADCVRNLAENPAFAARRTALREELRAKLLAQGDPRMSGQGDVFDRYPHANPAHAGFYERYLRGEKLNAGWVSKTDFEPKPLD